MGRVLNPNMLIESAEGMSNAGRAYINSMYEVKPAMEAILNDNELAGQTATAIKRRAEAHLTLLEHFQITEAMNTSELSKLKSALSNIKTEIDEDEIRATMEDEQRDIIFFKNQIAWLRKQDKEYSFGGLFNYYQYNVDASHNIINHCEKKLRDLDNFDAMSQSYFTNVIDNYQIQNQAIRDMMQVYIKGDYTNVDYSNISAIESRVKSFLSDKNKVNEILFDGNKLRKESLSLFTDTPRNKMSGVQRALYNRVIEFVLSDDCSADDLTSVVDAYYTDVTLKQDADKIIKSRTLLSGAKDFIEDIGIYLDEKIKNSDDTSAEEINIAVSKETLFKCIFLNDEIYDVKKITSKKDGRFTVYDASILKNGNVNSDIKDFKTYNITTTGSGNDGSYEFFKSSYIKMTQDNRNKLSDALLDIAIGRMKYVGDVADTLKVVNELDNVNAHNNDMLNAAKLDQATVTDEFITNVNGGIHLRKGKNTDKVVEYMESEGYSISDNPVENAINIYKYGDSINLQSVNQIKENVFQNLNLE